MKTNHSIGRDRGTDENDRDCETNHVTLILTPQTGVRKQEPTLHQDGLVLTGLGPLRASTVRAGLLNEDGSPVRR